MKESDSPLRVSFGDPQLANLLFGQQNKNLKRIEKLLKVRIGSKGSEAFIEGESGQAALAGRLLEELYALLQAG